jgi:hypothetical protein
MRNISRAALLKLDANSYRSHMAHHTFIAKSNSGRKIQDPRSDLTNIVEKFVRTEVEEVLELTDYRVLKWNQRNIYNEEIPKFKELDGVYETVDRSLVILEVKASAAKSGIKKGLKQLIESVNILSTIKQKTIGVLAIADMGRFSDAFGRAPDESLEELIPDKEFYVIEWPIDVSERFDGQIFVTFIPETTADNWMSKSAEMRQALCNLEQISDVNQ